VLIALAGGIGLLLFLGALAASPFGRRAPVVFVVRGGTLAVSAGLFLLGIAAPVALPLPCATAQAGGDVVDFVVR